MKKNTYFNKSQDQNITKEYDIQNYVKPSYCHTCCSHLLNTKKCYHEKTDNHKIAQLLRNSNPEPIEDIKKAVLEYKMIQKYIKTTFSNDSSTSLSNSEENDEPKVIDDAIICKLKRKSAAYKRELDHRAERYIRTKGVECIVNSIQSSKKRLTTFQIHKYNKYSQGYSMTYY
jgi:hypothetical protein